MTAALLSAAGVEPGPGARVKLWKALAPGGAAWQSPFMPEPRQYCDAALGAGAGIELSAEAARHVGTVLRLRVGDHVRLFNARDGEWRARLTRIDKKGALVVAEALVRPARACPALDLLFAPLKRQATDLIVEKATELGVRRIRPVFTRRTVAETVRLDRLNAIAQSAAEQTERFDLPEICEAVPLAKALDGWDEGRRLIYADESGDDDGAPWGGETGRAVPLLQALAFPPPLVPAKLALLIGPEGGFTLEERAMLRALPFVTPVSLGPRILRAETAVISALSVIQAAWGDWLQP